LVRTTIDLSDAQQQVASLIQERNDLKAHVETLEVANAESEKEVSSFHVPFSSEIRCLLTRLLSFHPHFQLEDISEQLGALNSKVNVAHAARRQSEQETAQLVAELAIVKEQLDMTHQLTAEKAKLERHLLEREENCKDLSEKLHSAKNEIRTLQQRLEGKEQVELQNESLVQHLRDMREEVAETEELKEQLAANANIVMNNDEMVSVHTSLYSVMSNCYCFLYWVSYVQFFCINQLRGLELELEEARTELARRALEAQQAAEDQEKIQQMLEQKQDFLEKVRSKLARTEMELEGKEKQLRDKTHELSIVQSQLSKHERDKDSLRDSIEKQQIKTFEDQETKLKQHIASLQGQLQQAKQMREDHLVEVAKYREEVRELRGDAEDAQVRVAELERELERLSESAGNGRGRAETRGSTRSPRKRQR
jgi:chromosome segregation ATPase